MNSWNYELIRHWQHGLKIGFGLCGPVLGSILLLKHFGFRQQCRVLINVGLFLLSLLFKSGTSFLILRGILLLGPLPKGLFSRFDLNIVTLWILGVMAIELTNYLIHRAEHRFGFLWKFHKIHHSDAEVDVSTFLRLHPLTPLYTSLIYPPVMILLGLPPEVMIVYQVVFDLTGFLHHSLIAKMPRWNQALRTLGLITPADHHIHHSRNFTESNLNFGSVFSFFDRIFGTYRAVDKIEGLQYGNGRD